MTEQVAINADRGEVGLTLDGRVYPMLPTFAAANAIESQLGAASSLFARLMKGSEQLPTWHELAVIATECIKAAGRDRNDSMLIAYNVEKVGEMIYAEGLSETLLASFVSIVGNMVSGGTNRKKAKAAETAAQATSESPTAN